MIEKFDISNLGSFSGFKWDASVRDSGNNIQKFKRLNILYGRNYSGKTTLSRIFRSLETGQIPENYSNPLYTVYDGNISTNQSEIGAHGYDIRVYNRDFVTDNLNFLVDQTNGEIKTFAIVGEKNKEIQEEIEKIEIELGSIEKAEGLRFNLDIKKKEKRQKENYNNERIESLESKIRNYANSKIKTNRIYGSANYNIVKIKRDILETQKPDFKKLTEEEKEEKISLVKQDALPDIPNTIKVNLKISEILEESRKLLSKLISPTQPIQELLNNSVLQMWVKEGIPLHKNKRETCAFCRQDLPHDIWNILDSHFNKESSDLETRIDKCLNSIDAAISEIPGFVVLTGSEFYVEERLAFEHNKIKLYKELGIYEQDLRKLQVALEKRKGNPFQTVEIPEMHSDTKEIQKYTDKINDLIFHSNSRTATLERDKASARDTLRLTDVASFVNEIGYEEEWVRIAQLQRGVQAVETDISIGANEVFQRETRIYELRNQQKDERKGAERVNKLLNNFFGHDGIKLEAKDDSENISVKFEITRDGNSAYNLSEGECSLIAFCYFIARLEEPNSAGKKLIIYIDDPISSLDGNHIFFMFSLIESVIAKPIKSENGSNDYLYKQLFISTHNLDFLKYLKKLSIPKKKVDSESGKKKSIDDIEHFMVERNGSSSDIRLMPSYLKDYITEFNYLFHQIYKCRNYESGNEVYEPFYSFGNNLRKFLEVFLFFKYPYQDNKNDGLERLKKFFGEDDAMAVVLINRLNNEFSHLECIPDRGFKPLEVPEICRVANFVLEKIRASDQNQYNALLKSIGVTEVEKII